MPGPNRKRKFISQTNDQPRQSPHSPGNAQSGQFLEQSGQGRQNQNGRDMRHQNQRRQSGRGGWNNNNNHQAGGGGLGGDRRGGQGGERQYQQHTQTGSRDRAAPPPLPASARQVPPSSGPTPQTPQVPTPVLAPLQQPTPDIPSPTSENLGFFYWEYITDARLKSWTTSGEAEVKQQAVTLHTGGNTEELSILLHEILQSCITCSRLSLQPAARLLIAIVSETTPDGIITGNPTYHTPTLLISTLSFFEKGEETPLSPKVPKLVQELIGAGSPLLPASFFLNHLDSQTLVSLGLVSEHFSRKTIRVFTNLIYKQQKYNLLREESEGYSKLITEFFTSSYSPSPLEVVDKTLDNVKALVGAFDLDPGRVLDVLLDTFACTLVANCRFFVRILKGGPWWPEEQPYNVLMDGDFFEAVRNATEGMGMVAEAKAFFRILFQSKRSGNKVAAQLLGFKFRYYQRKEVKDQMPDNLLVLSALLIKIGFVRLADLWPHLSPSAGKTEKKAGEQEEGELGSEEDEYMQGVLEKWKRNMEERAGRGKMNALMMAGALSDDTVPASLAASSSQKEGGATPARGQEAEGTKPEEKEKEKEKEREKPKEPLDQKIPLLRHLLAMGALPEAMFILGKYDWICGPEPDIADHIHRIIHFSIEDVYAPTRPAPLLADKVAGVSKKVPESIASPTQVPGAPTSQAAFVGGKTNLVDRPKRKITRTPTVFWSSNKTDDVEFRFFWDDWTDGVPKCKTVGDVLLLCRTLLRFSGVRISRDTGLMAKICRIGTRDVEDAIKACNAQLPLSRSQSADHGNMDEEYSTEAPTDGDLLDIVAKKAHKEKVLASWQQVLRELILPAVSLTSSNPGIVAEVWTLLSHYPTETRYCLYGEWSNIHCKRITELKAKTFEAEKETKDLLKRMNNKNVKEMARPLAKVAMSNPATVFAVILNQIEAYDNLVDCVVDAARYFTVMGYDVLVYTICTQLGIGTEGRGGRGGDGMGRRRWLNGKCYSLASRVCKRPNAFFSPQYVHREDSQAVRR